MAVNLRHVERLGARVRVVVLVVCVQLDPVDVHGLVTDGPGKKKDIGCCMKKEKHERCLKCTTMDCAFNTCKVNKNYYSEYSKIHKEATKDKNWDKKAMKAAGWGM